MEDWKNWKKMVRSLHTCAGLMEQGKFDANDLKYVKQMIEEILKTTEKAIEKNTTEKVCCYCYSIPCECSYYAELER